MRLGHAADPANRTKFDSLLAKHWGGKRPEHWLSKTMPERAEELGADEARRNREIYGQLCWCVHSGGAATADLDYEGIRAMYGWGHGMVQDLHIEAIRLIATEFLLHISDAFLHDKIKKAEIARAVYFLGVPQ